MPRGEAQKAATPNKRRKTDTANQSRSKSRECNSASAAKTQPKRATVSILDSESSQTTTMGDTQIIYGVPSDNTGSVNSLSVPSTSTQRSTDPQLWALRPLRPPLNPSGWGRMEKHTKGHPKEFSSWMRPWASGSHWSPTGQ